jgi:hypothetical protein
MVTLIGLRMAFLGEISGATISKLSGRIANGLGIGWPELKSHWQFT